MYALVVRRGSVVTDGLIGDLGIDLLSGHFLVDLAHAVGLLSVSDWQRKGSTCRWSVNESLTYDLLAHAAISRDFLSVCATKLLRASFKGLIKSILVSGTLGVVGIHVEVRFGWKSVLSEIKCKK
jgi:hypothetical protein